MKHRFGDEFINELVAISDEEMRSKRLFSTSVFFLLAGFHYEKRGEYEGAVRSYISSLEIFKSNDFIDACAYCEGNLIDILCNQEGVWDDEIVRYRQLLNQYPGEEHPYYDYLVDQYLEGGEYQKITDEFKDYWLNVGPDAQLSNEANLFYALIDSCVATDDISGAKSITRKIKNNPDQYSDHVYYKYVKANIDIIDMFLMYIEEDKNLFSLKRNLISYFVKRDVLEQYEIYSIIDQAFNLIMRLNNLVKVDKCYLGDLGKNIAQRYIKNNEADKKERARAVLIALHAGANTADRGEGFKVLVDAFVEFEPLFSPEIIDPSVR